MAIAHPGPDRTPENLMEALMAVIWPNGMPLKSDVMVLAAQWVEDTERFVRDLVALEVKAS